MKPRAALEAIFRAGVAACRADRLLPPHLPPAPPGRTIVLALGKSAVPMAQAVEASGRYERIDGLAVAPYGAPGALTRSPIAYAAHPVPDVGSEAGARMLLHMASEAGAGDLVLVLLSGGASALAAAPGKGLSLQAKGAVTEALLRSGAQIGEINAVRRHLSLIKGGRLAAAAWPAKVVTLAISDVVGDAPEAIGSGPTVADPTTVEDAKAVLARYGVADPGAGWSETLKPGDPRLEGGEYRIVGRNADALAAAAGEARRLGYEPVVLGEVVGEARDVAAAHARLALEHAAAGRRTALISGGELTVTVRGRGKGGPNQEYALALAVALDAAPGVWALACDSDGIDGAGGAAGGFATPDTISRARAAGWDAADALQANDSGGLLEAIGDRLVTGLTGVNVNDLRVVLIDPAQPDKPSA
jgi:hydroxypyruvate reductase